MSAATVEQILEIIFVWVVGMVLIYRWASQPRSWLRRLDGGSIKPQGNTYGLIGIFTAFIGLMLGIVLHNLTLFVTLGFLIGMGGGRIVARRLSQMATTQGFPVIQESSQTLTPKVRRNLTWIYSAGVAGAISSGFWEYYENHVRLWIAVIAVTSGFIVITILCWWRWSRWKKKHLTRSAE